MVFFKWQNKVLIGQNLKRKTEYSYFRKRTDIFLFHSHGVRIKNLTDVMTMVFELDKPIIESHLGIYLNFLIRDNPPDIC